MTGKIRGLVCRAVSLLALALGAASPALADVRWLELSTANAVRASAVAVGDARNTWILDTAKTAYRYFLGEWQPMPGQSFDGIAAGADGTVIGIQVAKSAGQHNQLYRFNSTTYQWEHLADMSQDRDIYAVAVGSATSIWGIDKATAYPCHWDGRHWIEAGKEKITVIAAGADNTAIGVNVRTNHVYFHTAGGWSYNASVGPQLMASAGNAQNYLFTDRKGQATVYLGGTPYHPGNPRMSSASIGADGTALGVADGKVYRLEIDAGGRARRFSPQAVADRRRDLTFLTVFSKGFLNESTSKWPTDEPSASQELTTYKDNGFNAVLIGYAPVAASTPGGVQLPVQRFNYDPVDVARTAGMKTIIDIEKYTKESSAVSYGDHARKVIAALTAKASGKDAIAAIHLYGEVDAPGRAAQVNAVAAQVTEFPTLAVAQENHIAELANMPDVLVRAGNYDDVSDHQRGYLESGPLSYALLSRYTNGFWYLVPWIRFQPPPNVFWRSIYGAVGMGARGVIWTQGSDVSAVFPQGQIKPGLEYVRDINNWLLAARLDPIVSADWKAGKLSPSKRGSALTDAQTVDQLRYDYVCLNPYDDAYHAGLFTKYRREHTSQYSTTREYYVLLLNWQNADLEVQLKVNADEIPGDPQALSARPPAVSTSHAAALSAGGITVNAKSLKLTLPPRGIVLLKMDGKTIVSKNPIL